MNLVDRLVAYFDPDAGLRRAHMRNVLAKFEAVEGDKQRIKPRDMRAPDAILQNAGPQLRAQARDLESNLDIADGALGFLTNTVIGPRGIGVEPQPKKSDGSIHADFAKAIRVLWMDFCKRPEVTHTMSMAQAERLAFRTWVRDGEVLAQHVMGNVSRLNHGTVVPYSVELLEPDYLPFDNDPARNIVQGVEMNVWGQRRAYHVYKQHPGGGMNWYSSGAYLDTKVVPAERMTHVRLVKRLHQTRGQSVFASCFNRLMDIKDYEASERIAAKVAASMAAYIKKGIPEDYKSPDAEGDDVEHREIHFRPGLIFDDLRPGEDVGTIDTSRPNSNAEGFLELQMRRTAAGIGMSYSSFSKNYDGTYSAQRQELVEQWSSYEVLAHEFVDQFKMPIYTRFIDMALASGQLVLPGDVDPLSLHDALWQMQQMPWIDPKKEAEAWAMLEENGHASGPEIIRRRGRNPDDVVAEEMQWREKTADLRTGAETSMNEGNDNAA